MSPPSLRVKGALPKEDKKLKKAPKCGIPSQGSSLSEPSASPRALWGLGAQKGAITQRLYMQYHYITVFIETFKTPRGFLYNMIMEVGPKRPSVSGFSGPHSMMVLNKEPLKL